MKLGFVSINTRFKSVFSLFTDFSFFVRFCDFTTHRFLSTMALNRDPHRDFVSSICPGREGWNLYVKIVQLWSVPDLNGQKLPFSMEMVLMDERVFFCVNLCFYLIL